MDTLDPYTPLFRSDKAEFLCIFIGDDLIPQTVQIQAVAPLAVPRISPELPPCRNRCQRQIAKLPCEVIRDTAGVRRPRRGIGIFPGIRIVVDVRNAEQALDFLGIGFNARTICIMGERRFNSAGVVVELRSEEHTSELQSLLRNSYD